MTPESARQASALLAGTTTLRQKLAIVEQMIEAGWELTKMEYSAPEGGEAINGAATIDILAGGKADPDLSTLGLSTAQTRYEGSLASAEAAMTALPADLSDPETT